MKKITRLNFLKILIFLSILLTSCVKNKNEFIFKNLYEVYITSIAEILKENKIKYEITDKGETIIIDYTKRSEVFDLLAKNGITGRKEFEKYLNSKINEKIVIPPYIVNKKKYLLQLQMPGEIAVVYPDDLDENFSTIFEQMVGIREAKVTIIKTPLPHEFSIILKKELNYKSNEKDLSIVKGIIISSFSNISEKDISVTIKPYFL
jgi:hypothetical protein